MARELQVVGLSLEEFEQLIRTIVKECLRDRPITTGQADKALNIQQACRFLGISAPTLRKYVRASLLRQHKLGPRRKVFYLQELEEDIKNLPL
jgi:predicted DNA-binding transcriptional regulator AlpA